MLAVEAALKGRRVLEAAPTQDQTEAFWEACKKAMAAPLTAGVVRKDESRRLLELPGGARIRCKTAWDADTLRGDYADLLILDEYSLMSVSTWNEVGAPMLLDNNGDAVFIFTPKRKNHAYHAYLKAMQDTGGRWEAWHFTSMDNPYLSVEALSEITADMTDDAYRQEILAEFLESEGAVFRNLAACMKAPHPAEPHIHKNHFKVMGADWGKQQDFTCLSVFCSDCLTEVDLDRFNQIDYAFQRGRLMALAERWHVGYIEAESNAMGEPIIEQLQRDGLPVTAFQTTLTTKPPLIESLALAFEREEAQWLDLPWATTELEAYERKVSPTTNRSTYSAPAGVHDDSVIARALGWHAASSGESYGEVSTAIQYTIAAGSPY